MGKFTLRAHALVGARIAEHGQSGHIRAQSGHIRATTAGEFEKAAKGCAQPTCRILDWFHIAMKLSSGGFANECSVDCLAGMGLAAWS
jgi:hypothetical protein